MRHPWGLWIDSEPQLEHDVRRRLAAAADSVASGAAPGELLLWLPLVDGAAPETAGPTQSHDLSHAEWIKWASVSTAAGFAARQAATDLEAGAEWAVSTIRQLGLQASVATDGSIMTPMGPIGHCTLSSSADITAVGAVRLGTEPHAPAPLLPPASSVDVVMALGTVNYAAPVDPAYPEGENVRSQSGLPLPLVIDRFRRMARVLFNADETN